jgi:proline dehydrogenase
MMAPGARVAGWHAKMHEMPAKPALKRSVRRLARGAAFRVGTSDRVERTVLASPALRRLAFCRAKRYVAGVDEGDAIATVRALQSVGLAASVDLFGENTDDASYADAVTKRYVALAATLADHPRSYVSLDCSHLGLDQDPARCGERVERIAASLRGDARLQLGAEQSARTDAILGIAYTAAQKGLPVMATVQANLRRSAEDVEALANARVPVRLVKGAYVEDDQVAHAWGPPTDGAYIALAQRLAELGADHSLATHDPALLDQLTRDRHEATLEFLLGVRSEDARRLAAAGHQVRIYVPFGPRWFRYYARRAAESIRA